MGDSQISNSSDLPLVDWIPQWPVHKLSWRGIIFSYAMSAGFSCLAVIVIVLGVRSEIENAHIVTLIGMLAGSLMFIGLALMAFYSVTLSRTRPRSGVNCVSDNTYGKGVVFHQRKIPLNIFMLLTGMGVYGFLAWLDWRNGVYEDGLLPFSKDDGAGATWMLIVGVVGTAVLIFFAALTRRKTYLELYPSGIRRVIDTPIGLTDDTFIEWSEIASLEAGTYRPSARSNDLPKIDVHLGAPRTSVHPRLDQPDLIMLPIHVLVAGPNTVLAIVRILLSQPETRDLLARPDADAWFIPPTMSEQRRLSVPAIKNRAAQ